MEIKYSCFDDLLEPMSHTCGIISLATILIDEFIRLDEKESAFSAMMQAMPYLDDIERLFAASKEMLTDQGIVYDKDENFLKTERVISIALSSFNSRRKQFEEKYSVWLNRFDNNYIKQ